MTDQSQSKLPRRYSHLSRPRRQSCHLRIGGLWWKFLWHWRFYSRIRPSGGDSWSPNKYLWNSWCSRTLLFPETSRGRKTNSYRDYQLLWKGQFAFLNRRAKEEWPHFCRYWSRANWNWVCCRAKGWVIVFSVCFSTASADALLLDYFLTPAQISLNRMDPVTIQIYSSMFALR